MALSRVNLDTEAHLAHTFLFSVYRDFLLLMDNPRFPYTFFRSLPPFPFPAAISYIIPC